MATTPPPANTRILVIDDDSATLQLLHGVLEANGYAPLVATSAAQALATLDATPDILLAISDINMPGMDGIAFLERLGSEGSAQGTPGVIFLTAHARVDFAVAALRLGALDFLTKPVRPKELLQAVSRAVERVQRNRADNPRDFALLGMEQVRRLRRAFPLLSDFDDVTWHLLLELASADKRGQRLSVSALCVSIDNVSSTTALRRIQDLVKSGHLERVPDPADARRDFVTLDSATQAVLDQYLERVGQELAAVAHSG